MAATKIATCCYCGTKAALILRGKDRRELACSNCGAPLHVLKMLPVQPGQQNVTAAAPKRKSKRKHTRKDPEYRSHRAKKRKKSKGFGRRMISEIWDVVEEVVDEIFD